MAPRKPPKQKRQQNRSYQPEGMGRQQESLKQSRRGSARNSYKAEQPREGFAKRGERAERGPKPYAQRGRAYGAARGRQNGYIKAGEDVSILEGRHAFEEAVATKTAIDTIFVTNALLQDAHISELVEEAKAQRARVRIVDTDVLDDYSSHGAHQGIMAKLKPYSYANVSELVAAAAGKEDALIIATDHVTDAGNFGAIVRTAEVIGATGVLIPNKRNARVNTAAYKTSAGAVLHTPIALEANLARTLSVLKEEGFWIVGASEHAEEVLWDAPLSGRVVLVMGSEDQGLSRVVQEECDLLVKLPQLGNVESLNVAQACTALSYEWARQCRAAKE